MSSEIPFLNWFDDTFAPWNNYDKNGDSYEQGMYYYEMKESGIPFISSYGRRKFSELLQAEDARRDADLYRNTGQSRKNSPYPIRDRILGLYSSDAAGGYYDLTGELFGVSESIMRMYKKW